MAKEGQNWVTGITVVLPDNKGLKVGAGTKVYAADGQEITGIERIDISIVCDDIIKATMIVAVSELRNADGLLGTFICAECGSELEQCSHGETEEPKA